MMETLMVLAAITAGAYLGMKVLEVYALAHQVRLVGGLHWTVMLAIFVILAVIFL